MPEESPHRVPTVTPSLVVTPCAEAIDFSIEAFDAEEIEPRMTGPDGSNGHAEIRIGQSVIMLADEWPDGPVRSPTALGGSTAAFFIHTDDVDALWDRAIAAGAEEVFPLEIRFHGDKAGGVRGAYGHTWGLARQVEELDADEMARRMSGFYEE
jgi:PhnB protein